MGKPPSFPCNICHFKHPRPVGRNCDKAKKGKSVPIRSTDNMATGDSQVLTEESDYALIPDEEGYESSNTGSVHVADTTIATPPPANVIHAGTVGTDASTTRSTSADGDPPGSSQQRSTSNNISQAHYNLGIQGIQHQLQPVGAIGMQNPTLGGQQHAAGSLQVPSNAHQGQQFAQQPHVQQSVQVQPTNNQFVQQPPLNRAFIRSSFNHRY